MYKRKFKFKGAHWNCLTWLTFSWAVVSKCKEGTLFNTGIRFKTQVLRRMASWQYTIILWYNKDKPTVVLMHSYNQKSNTTNVRNLLLSLISKVLRLAQNSVIILTTANLCQWRLIHYYWMSWKLNFVTDRQENFKLLIVLIERVLYWRSMAIMIILLLWH